MAVTSPQAIAFSNGMIRSFADHASQRYWEAKALVEAWNAQGMSALFPNDTTAVSDGAATDGRPLITGADVTNVVTRAMELITDYEATSNAKLNTIAKVAVNPRA